MENVRNRFRSIRGRLRNCRRRGKGTDWSDKRDIFIRRRKRKGRNKDKCRDKCKN